METIETLRGRLESAKRETLEAHARLVKFQKGGGLDGWQILQHKFLVADALEIDLARQVRDAKDLLDLQARGQ